MTQPRGGKPTVRQVYALAAALCALCDERFPETRDEASQLIERLRRQLGHPAPRLEDTPRPRGRRRRLTLVDEFDVPVGFVVVARGRTRRRDSPAEGAADDSRWVTSDQASDVT
jgi:hypothetical protein